MEEKKSTIIRGGNPGDRRIWTSLGKSGDPELQDLIIFFKSRPTVSDEEERPPTSIPEDQKKDHNK